MGCGHGVGGVLMEDLIYPHLWKDTSEFRNSNDEDSDHDLRKLFPKKKSTKRTVNKVSKKGTPEWLAVSVGVFFIGALFTIASYQVYRGNFSTQSSPIKVYDDFSAPVVLSDEPQEDVYNKLELPPDIVPNSYIVYLRINVKKKTYKGLVGIEVTCKHNTSRLILHSAYHKIKEIQLKSEDNTSIPVDKVSWNRQKDFLILSLSETLVEGHKYYLLLGFSAKLDYTFTNGIYLSKYKDGNGATREMVSTDLEPERARKVHPCFDEPTLKATWTFVIVAENKGFHARSNMPVEKTNVLKDGKEEVFFQKTPVMSSYLISVLVTEYDHKEIVSPGNVTIGACAPIGRIDEVDKALEYAALAVDYFSKKLGIDYMLPKMDMYPVSKFSAGAAEAWGNIVFSEICLLTNPESASDSHRKRVAEVVCHEISHMWFGDLVTMRSWKDLWLKEAFAEYLMTLPVGIINPLWDTKKSFYSKASSALSFDFSPYTHAIKTPGKLMNSSELLNSYDTITYEKGASIINMLGQFIGDDAMFKGLRVYLKRFQYGNTDASQLWEAFSEACDPINVLDFMNSWVTQAGFPVVNIEASNDNTFKVTQEKYKYKGLDDEIKADETEGGEEPLWHVPLNIMTCNGENVTKRLLTTKQDEFSVKVTCETKLYKANFGGTGFYHVNYDKDNWYRLLDMMNTDHLMLPDIDRASILYDAYSLTSSNNNDDITLPLHFTQYLWKEDYPEAWSSGITIIFKVRNVYRNTSLKKCAETYTSKKMTPVLDKLNMIRNHSHSQIVLIKQLLSYANTFDTQPFSKIMVNLFLKWAVSDGEEKLPANTRGVILCAGVRNGDVYSFDYVNKSRHNAKSVEDRDLFKSALACTKDKGLLQRLVDEGVNKTDALILRTVCGNHRGKDMAWKAVKNNWDALYEKYKVDNGQLKFLLNACVDGRKEEDLQDAVNFVDSVDMGRFKVYALRAIEGIKHNIDFAKRHKEAVTSWFKKYAKCPI